MPWGRGGFRLSLLRYDPGATTPGLSLSLRARANLKQPEKSLILRKRGFLADARSMIKLPIEAHDSLIFLDAQ